MSRNSGIFIASRWCDSAQSQPGRHAFLAFAIEALSRAGRVLLKQSNFCEVIGAADRACSCRAYSQDLGMWSEPAGKHKSVKACISKLRFALFYLMRFLHSRRSAARVHRKSVKS